MNIAPYSEDQTDALQEVANIAMGQAGDSLARIMGHFVELSVPRIRLVTVQDLVATVSEMVGAKEDVAAVRQAFYNQLRGEAIVVIKQSGADELAELMDYEDEVDSEAEEELLLEVANLLVGAIINGISETLEAELGFSAPSLMTTGAPLERVLTPDKLTWSHALLVEVHLCIEGHKFKSHLLLFMAEESIDALRGILDDFIDDL